MMTAIYPTVSILIDNDGDNVPETSLSDRIVSDIGGQHGIFSYKETDRLPSAGSMTFSIDNSDGTYTAVDAMVGRAVALALTVSGVTKQVFYSYITKAVIDPDTTGPRRVNVTTADWINVANNSRIQNIPLATFVTSDEALPTLLAATPNPPARSDLEAGYEEFPNMYDGALEKTTVFSELDKVVKSELAYGYLTFRDGASGETFRAEAYLTRAATNPLARVPVGVVTPGFLKFHGNLGATGYLKYHGNAAASGKIKVSDAEDATFDRTMIDSEWEAGANTVNQFSVNQTPRRTDTSDVVLFTLNSPIRLTHPLTIIKGTWKDPNGGTVIAATDVVTPVYGVDYTVNSKSDGTGLALSVKQGFVWGTNGFTLTINPLAQSGYVVTAQVRGRGIYKYDTIETLAENTESQEDIVKAKFADSLTREYSSGYAISRNFAERVIAIDRTPRKVMKSVTFIANCSEHLMMSFLYLDQGAKVQIVESSPSHTGTYYIQGIKFRVTLGGIVYFTWFLKEEAKTICQPIGVKVADVGNRTAINYGVLPYLNNLYQFSYSLWVKRLGGGNFCVLFGKSIDNGSGRRGNYLLLSNADLIFICHRTPTDGRWDAVGALPLTDTWYHVAVVYDNRSYENDPLIYVNGSAAVVTEVTTPVGNYDDDSDCYLTIGNIGPDPAVDGQVYYYDTMHDAQFKNMRIYNRLLTASEVTTLGAPPSQDTYSNVQSGLVFMGIYAPTDNIADYIGDTISDQDLLLEAVYGAAGTPYNEDTTTTEMLRGLAL